MTEKEGRISTAREMVRSHAYPFLAALSTVFLAVIAASLVPISKQQAKNSQEGSSSSVSHTSNTSTMWLMVAGRNGGKNDYGTTSAVLRIHMNNEMDCEAAGLKLMGDKNIHGKVFEHVRYSCLKGK